MSRNMIENWLRKTPNACGSIFWQNCKATCTCHCNLLYFFSRFPWNAPSKHKKLRNICAMLDQRRVSLSLKLVQHYTNVFFTGENPKVDPRFSQQPSIASYATVIYDLMKKMYSQPLHSVQYLFTPVTVVLEPRSVCVQKCPRNHPPVLDSRPLGAHLQQGWTFWNPAVSEIFRILY